MKKVLISIDWSENAEKAFDCKYVIFQRRHYLIYRKHSGKTTKVSLEKMYAP